VSAWGSVWPFFEVLPPSPSAGKFLWSPLLPFPFRARAVLRFPTIVAPQLSFVRIVPPPSSFKRVLKPINLTPPFSLAYVPLPLFFPPPANAGPRSLMVLRGRLCLVLFEKLFSPPFYKRVSSQGPPFFFSFHVEHPAPPPLLFAPFIFFFLVLDILDTCFPKAFALALSRAFFPTGPFNLSARATTPPFVPSPPLLCPSGL